MFDAIQISGGLILALCYLPQIRQILKTRGVRDLNTKTFGLITLGIALMEVYAVNLARHGGFAFLVTNTMSLLIALTMFILVLAYRKIGA